MLSDAQVKHYRTEGYLVVKQLLSDPEIDVLKSRTEAIAEGTIKFPATNMEFEPNSHDREPHIDNLRKLNDCARHDQLFFKHACNPAILDIIEILIGPDIKLLSDQLFMKPPGGMEKTYHQDSPYFSIEPMDLVSSWAALDDANLDNGCVWIIPGSHLGGPISHSEKWMVGDREDMHVPESAFDRTKERPIVLKAGDVSFHHSLLLHRSGPNRSQQRRRGLATHFMSAASIWTGASSEKPNYSLVRGRTYEDCV